MGSPRKASTTTPPATPTEDKAAASPSIATFAPMSKMDIAILALLTNDPFAPMAMLETEHAKLLKLAQAITPSSTFAPKFDYSAEEIQQAKTKFPKLGTAEVNTAVARDTADVVMHNIAALHAENHKLTNGWLGVVLSSGPGMFGRSAASPRSGSPDLVLPDLGLPDLDSPRSPRSPA